MSNTRTGPAATQTTEPTEGEAITPDTEINAAEGEPELDTYPAHVVRKLRDENGTTRARLRDTELRVDELTARAETAESERDELAVRLHAELVRSTGRLTDPSDLEFDAEHLNDADKLAAAINELVNAKPHLKARKVSGDAGQGNRGEGAQVPTFASLLGHAS